MDPSRQMQDWRQMNDTAATAAGGGGQEELKTKRPREAADGTCRRLPPIDRVGF